MTMYSLRRDLVVLATALITAAGTGRALAIDDGKPQCTVAISNTTSRAPSVGGAFSLEAREVSINDASVGGPYRLVRFSRFKAESTVFADGFESGDGSRWSGTVPEVQFPSAAVVAFDLAECPVGWKDARASYRGRAQVGLMPGGQLHGGTGSGWTGENDSHYHYPDFTVTTDSRGHNYHWATLVNASITTWQSLNASNQTVNLVTWQGGIGAEGSGHYPLATTPGDWLYTKNSSHTHQLTFDQVILDWDLDPQPNVQLRFCRKE
jgi:hypothetical protein